MNGSKPVWLGLLALALLSPVSALAEADGWGFLAQAFVVEKISASRGGGSLAGYYGAAGVNVFSTTSSAWCREQLFDATHRQFQTFWEARTSAPISFDYGLGLASQNNIWGTNATALNPSQNDGVGLGYILEKALLLSQDLPLADFGIDLPADQEAELYQDFISLAVESRLAGSRRQLGAVLARAAQHRTERFPSMLVDAYAGGIAESCGTDTAQVAKMMERQEKAFRRTVQGYGEQVFRTGRKGFSEIVRRWAERTAATWNNLGIHSVTAGELRRLARYYLPVADRLIQGDYLVELRATADRVGDELIDRLIFPGGGGTDGGGTDDNGTDGGGTDGGDTGGDTTDGETTDGTTDTGEQ